MQANWREITAVFSIKNSYVLATIIDTRGATYQKMGAMMLITEQGECFGLLSGGCLEADISLHAKQVLLSEKSKIIRYDLSSDADLLWGLGLGCDGAIDILLQPLLIKNNHLGFYQLLCDINAQKTGYFVQNIPLEILKQLDLSIEFEPFGEFISSKCINYSMIKDKAIALQQNSSFIVTPIKPPINLLICGAGPDVVPVAAFAWQMGWQVTLWDHRKMHLQEPSFSKYQRQCIRAEYSLLEDYSAFDAAIVMTHNLAMDSDYLSKLLTTSEKKLSYIGLLGPQSRRDKLLQESGVDSHQVQSRVYAPVGLNLGGRGAEAIALSIISEIQQHFFTNINSNQNSERSIICCSDDVEITKALTQISLSNVVNGTEYV